MARIEIPERQRPLQEQAAETLRDRGRPSGLSEADARALAQLDARTTCQQCGWQTATVLSRHRLLCQVCCQYEQLTRLMDATAARIRRSDRK